MNPELPITAVVLCAALLHAVWNAVLKTGEDRLATLAHMNGPWLLVAAPMVALLPLPAPESWPYLAGSVLLHWVYMLGLLWMYRVGDLSHVYPLARGSAPLVLSLLSWWVAGELLHTREWLGVALVSMGVLTLTLQGGRSSRADWRPVAAALFVGATIVGYTLTDGLGVRRAGTTLGYVMWLFGLMALPWWVALARVHLGRRVRMPRRALLSALACGVMAMTAYALVIWALRQASMAPVAALRETSVIFAALIGTLKLGEPFGRRRVLASVLVAAGVALINLPG